jgi:hypothetical protein
MSLNVLEHLQSQLLKCRLFYRPHSKRILRLTQPNTVCGAPRTSLLHRERYERAGQSVETRHVWRPRVIEAEVSCGV